MKRSLQKIFLVILCFVFISPNILAPLNSNISYAYETTCPEEMSDMDCLNFLREQANLINSDKSALEGELSAELYEQLTLKQKIDYLNGQIAAREITIQQLEIDIESKNVEIRIIAKDIKTIQDNLTTLNQEVQNLQDIINKRLSQTYKNSKISTLETLLSAENLESFIRKTKYTYEARKKDKSLLEDLNNKKVVLQAEEKSLEIKQQEAQDKRNEIENQKSVLYEEKVALEPQKTEVDILIAESKQREEEYNAQIAALSGLQNSIDSQIVQLIMTLYHQGGLGNGTAVAQGQIIGFQGHTGCSFGSHLHFGIVTSDAYRWEANVNPFSGYLNGGPWYGAMLSNGSANSPLSGAYVTQGFHQGMYLDLVSLYEGDQSGSYYWVNPGEISCSPGTSGWFSLTGEGAPVYAIMSGTVYYGVESWGGANYALVDHHNGLVSMYVHLR